MVTCYCHCHRHQPAPHKQISGRQHCPSAHASTSRPRCECLLWVPGKPVGSINHWPSHSPDCKASLQIWPQTNKQTKTTPCHTPRQQPINKHKNRARLLCQEKFETVAMERRDVAYNTTMIHSLRTRDGVVFLNGTSNIWTQWHNIVIYIVPTQEPWECQARDACCLSWVFHCSDKASRPKATLRREVFVSPYNL